jgi:hypothetical protein
MLMIEPSTTICAIKIKMTFDFTFSILISSHVNT